MHIRLLCSEVHVTNLEAGKSQNLLDDARQQLRAPPHSVNRVMLFLVQRAENLVGEKLFVTGYGRQRSAQFVGHHGDELVLRLVGCFGLIEQPGLPQRERRLVGQCANPANLRLGKCFPALSPHHRDYAHQRLVREQRR